MPHSTHSMCTYAALPYTHTHTVLTAEVSIPRLYRPKLTCPIFLLARTAIIESGKSVKASNIGTPPTHSPSPKKALCGLVVPCTDIGSIDHGFEPGFRPISGRSQAFETFQIGGNRKKSRPKMDRKSVEASKSFSGPTHPPHDGCTS